MARLLRGVARTAVVAGTATHVSNNVSRRQAKKYAEKDQQQASQQQQVSPRANYQEDAGVDEQLVQLSKLGQLRDQGILTQQEFDAKKKQILDV